VAGKARSSGMEGETRRRRKGVLRDLHPLGDGPCRSLADSGARVPKVLPTAELEGFLFLIVGGFPHWAHHCYAA
jgi:hypothetical protein